MISDVKDMEKTVKTATDGIDNFNTRLCALEKLETQYGGWLSEYHEKIANQELFI